jgi:archaellum biogenesis ATPase FlaH
MLKIPTQLKQRKQWVNWKLVTRGNDKPTKVPIHPDGKPASSTDPETWCEFGAVVESSNKYSGIGFVFSPDDPFCGVDFDVCRDPQTGKVDEWAATWIRLLDSYSEISPSGTGIKVWIEATLNGESGKKISLPQYKTGEKVPGIEVYDRARYFAVTGWRYDKLPHEPQPRQKVLDALCAEFFKPELRDGGLHASTRLSVIERARRYLDTIPGAVSGSGGHNQIFKAACVLVLGFNLTKTEALILLSDYNNRCEPRWTEKELRHKIDSADKQPGKRGFLRRAKDEDWGTIKLPGYEERQAPGVVCRSQPTVITLEQSVDKYIDKMTSDKDSLLSTGLQLVDNAIGGGVDLHEMVLICARPSHGKSAFALQALDAAAYMDQPCAIISEEMSAIALGKRTIQYATEVPQSSWVSRPDDVRADLKKHFSRRAPCYVVEGCGSAVRACDELKKLYDTKGVRVAAIDYAQLLSSKGSSRYEQITQTSMALRSLANNTDMILYVLCQLNRAIEGRDKFIPRLDDIKDSGQLEQDADVILFLVWPYRIDTHKTPDLYEVWIGKVRNRSINAPEVDCRFNPSRQMILPPRVENPYQPEDS